MALGTDLTRPAPGIPCLMPSLNWQACWTRRSIPMSGDGDTPLAGAYSPADLATVGGLSVARYAYDLTDWDNSLWAIPLGASGNPGSPHYHDQSETWRQVQMIPMEYGWEGIAARSQARQTLEPAQGRNR